MSKKNKTIAYTRVSADISHYGHLRLLQNAKKISDYHICGLYDDNLCLKWVGKSIW
jgi:ethanolamine-phosphate cytidylyltransferase